MTDSPPDHLSSAGIIMIGTCGGTISSVETSRPDKALGSKKAHVAPQLSVMQELLANLGDERLRSASLFSIDSSYIQWEHERILHKHISEWNDDPTIAAIIITHGTDTMEESAFLINCTISVHKPVIFTGAMYAHDHALADGLTNLRAAIKDSAELGPGVWIRMGEACIPAHGAYKTSTGFTSLPQAKGSLNGIIPHLPHELESTIVPVILCYVGMPIELISHQLASCDGAIIQAFGSGNVSQELESIIGKYSSHKPVVITSRVSHARVAQTYASANVLADNGAILCSGLPAVQLRILVHLMLAEHYPLAHIATVLAHL